MFAGSHPVTFPAEITYCCNYWQMHKNLSAIATAWKVSVRISSFSGPYFPFLVSGMYIFKKSIVWRYWLQPSILSTVLSLFYGSTWSDPYVKDTVRKFERYVFLYIEESHCSPALLKVPIYSTELDAVIFDWKCCVKCTKALAVFPFFHGECVNLTI